MHSTRPRRAKSCSLFEAASHGWRVPSMASPIARAGARQSSTMTANASACLGDNEMLAASQRGRR